MNNYFWFAFLPVHFFAGAALFFYDNTSLAQIFVYWVLLSGYGVGVNLHRLLSHKAFKTYKPIEYALSFISCLCVQGSPLFWVNIHRGYHHRHSDKEQDIHSPIHGKLSAYFLWACTINPKTISYKYVPDLLRSKYHMWLSENYFLLLWTVWLVVFSVSVSAFLSLVIAQIITMHLEFCVNLFCHIDGVPTSYRNFDTNDNSKNYWLFGLLCWGIGYHNNHHAKPNEVSFAYKKFEFDPTVILVRLIKK